MSRLPICTMGKGPVACLLDSLHSSHALQRFGLMLPTAGRSWLPGAKCKVGGIWKSSNERQVRVASASCPGVGWWNEHSRWISRNRRLSKDYERKVQTSETLIPRSDGSPAPRSCGTQELTCA